MATGERFPRGAEVRRAVSQRKPGTAPARVHVEYLDPATRQWTACCAFGPCPQARTALDESNPSKVSCRDCANSGMARPEWLLAPPLSDG